MFTPRNFEGLWMDFEVFTGCSDFCLALAHAHGVMRPSLILNLLLLLILARI